MNVVEAHDAPFAEHVMGILTGSYTVMGGLSGKTGGDTGMLTRAITGSTQETWKNGLDALAKQGVYLENTKNIKIRLKMDQLVEKYREEESEFDGLKQAQKLAEDSKKNWDECASALMNKGGLSFQSLFQC